MSFIYNLGIKAYRLGVRLAAKRNHKALLMLEGQRRTFDVLRQKLNPAHRHIWIHASSLGEFEQGRPLIERIKKENPDARIVLSFFSPSGYEVRKDYALVDAVVYLPFDVSADVKQFIDLVNPSMAIFVKYEFWGNYLHELKRRQIPTYIISAIFRESQIFFKPWGGEFRDMLRCFTRIYVQNEDSRQLLKSIDIHNVEVAGDTRFDRVADVRAAAKEFPVIAAFAQNSPFTLVMGSSWQPDEDIVMPYFNEHPNMKLIIAPHEFDSARLSAIMAKSKRRAGLYSKTTEEQAAQLDCLIIDCFGILSSLYRYGQMAYVGGGFGAGIHNINEAAVYGIPVVFGPKFGKFAEALDLIAIGGGHCVREQQEFNALMDKMLSTPSALETSGNIAGNYIATHTGATTRIYRDLFPKPRK
ncbi:MAG: glycosyltransferase N-terminal domain-containing protein [Bacteroidales bacterium]|nr:glycosyltransferase N-terminal domain-containing protein [Bacteroidales bacterium]